MRVGIDARFITRYPRRGIGNYSLNLVNQLVELDKSIHYILYISESDSEGLLPKCSNVTVRKLWPSIYPIWENISLPIAAIKDKLDLLHCLGNTAPLYLPKSICLVLSLMDVMFLQVGEFIPEPTSAYQRLGRLYRSLVVPWVAKSAKHLITISNFSKVDILRSISSIDPNNLSVTYLSCDSIFKNQKTEYKKHGDKMSNLTDHPFILCLGAEDPRKNTHRVVRTYLSLLDKYSIEENLIVCGYSNWKNSQSYKEVKLAHAEKRVIFLEFVSVDILALLYRNASLFVYASLYEGFGIPLLEAFSSGCPVVAANVTSISEVGGDAVVYFNPLKEDEIAHAIMRVIIDPTLCDTIKLNGLKQAHKFSWEITASETIKIYKRCLVGKMA